jgi:tRNA pseudouridine38-40 synthase
VASRTDRGVSARGNALALTSSLPGPALLRALNGVAAEVVFTDARVVEENFRPRAAVSRTYHYLEEAPVGPVAAYREAAAAAVGDIDVRSFGRGLPGGRPIVRTVSRFEAKALGRGLVLEIEAPSFVWGMVRKLVASVRNVVAGELDVATFRSALSGRRRLTLPLAEPEPLLLWEVSYGVPWTVHATTLADRQRAYFHTERHAARVRERLLERLGTGRFSGDEASKAEGSPDDLRTG